MSRFQGWSPLAGSLLDDARSLSREEFARRHPDAVLVVPLVQSKDATRITTRVMRADPAERARRDALPFDFVPVKKSPTNLSNNLVTLGRTDTNDVVIASSEVSKLHALFMLDRASGLLTITDAGSTNGTKVNGRTLTPRTEAEPLRGGEELLLGTVKLVFHVPATLHDFLRSLEPGRQ
jgi:pSer/pThr/pTyr-binding forkhead associated (FHA) protein